MEFLVFHLYGPMASWGATAVGEYRPSHSHPTKSAIVGLIAGCLGIRRDEEERQIGLYQSLGFAVATLANGNLLRDYHTVQMPSREKGKFATRKDELNGKSINTLLSSRDYRTDAFYRVALWSQSSPSVNLEDIAAALKRPIFSPHLGRKSCPPAMPFEPSIIQADRLSEALTRASHSFAEYLATLTTDSRQAPPGKRSADRFVVHHDPLEDDGLRPIDQHQIKDLLLSRTRWQFGDRTECTSSLGGEYVFQ